MKTNAIKALIFAIVMATILSLYSAIFGIEISGNVIAASVYKLLWALLGVGMHHIAADER